MDADMVERLCSGEGWGLLQSLPPYDESAVLGLQAALRDAGFAPDLVAAALTQSRLRSRAEEKFGEFARGMLFTPDGLEQATRLAVAGRHAERFAAAGVREVLDLGCGIGSDAMAFASLDLAVDAVDADAATALVADRNLRHWPEARARCARAEDVALPRDAAGAGVGAWLDPARRVSGVADARGRTRRVFSLDAISPPWDVVLGVAAAVPATGAKLSPQFPHGAVPRGAEAQWTSWEGEVVECTVWWGPLVREAGRTAAVCGRGGTSVVTQEQARVGDDAEALRSLDGMGQWLYEPDRAVIRAGLVGALVAAVDGAEVQPGLGYVSADTVRDVPWARRHRVLEAMPLSTKRLARWLRDHGHDRVTIKKKGVTLDPDVLRRQLKMTGRGRGGSEATVVLTRVGGSQVALVVDPA